jgi:hypothetical protein
LNLLDSVHLAKEKESASEIGTPMEEQCRSALLERKGWTQAQGECLWERKKRMKEALPLNNYMVEMSNKEDGNDLIKMHLMIIFDVIQTVTLLLLILHFF